MSTLDTLQTAVVPVAGVYGYCYDANGNPIIGSVVQVMQVNERAALAGTKVGLEMTFHRAVTDRFGYWSLWLTPADYIVRDAGVRAFRIRPVTPSGAVVGDADAMLVPSGPVKGTYVHGQSVTDITV